MERLLTANLKLYNRHEDLLSRANLPSLYDRKLQEILLYKVRNGLCPEYIAELFNFSNKGSSLRNADFNTGLATQQYNMEITLLGTWGPFLEAPGNYRAH